MVLGGCREDERGQQKNGAAVPKNQGNKSARRNKKHISEWKDLLTPGKTKTLQNESSRKTGGKKWKPGPFPKKKNRPTTMDARLNGNHTHLKNAKNPERRQKDNERQHPQLYCQAVTRVVPARPFMKEPETRKFACLGTLGETAVGNVVPPPTFGTGRSYKGKPNTRNASQQNLSGKRVTGGGEKYLMVPNLSTSW